MSDSYQGKWEKRWHPLREEWVVYSAHRTRVPGREPESLILKNQIRTILLATYARETRAFTVTQIPSIQVSTFLIMTIPWWVYRHRVTNSLGFYKKESALGVARVVCYDPRHNITLSQMQLEHVVNVFTTFQNQMVEFENNPDIKSVLIFENKGEAVGSNSHPHCQVYVVDFSFNLVEATNCAGRTLSCYQSEKSF
ncbi:MAG: hypothetical protein U5K54_00965 [Cytophagales bacterium]|nr:hypothetical protein [Cytophagales bacterium]